MNRVTKISVTGMVKACQIDRKPNTTRRKGVGHTIEADKGAIPSTRTARG